MTGMMPFSAGPMMDTLLTCRAKGPGPCSSKRPDRRTTAPGADAHHLRRLRPRPSAPRCGSTAGFIGFRNTHGATPMNTAIAMAGHEHPPLARARGPSAPRSSGWSRRRSSRAGTSRACRPPTGSRRSRPRPSSHGFHRNAPNRIRNSPTNPFRPGSPIDDSVMTKNAATSLGITCFRPPNSAMRRVCRRSDSMPTMRKSAPVETPWFSIW